MEKRLIKFTNTALERLSAPPKRWSEAKEKEIGQYVLYHLNFARSSPFRSFGGR